jgi:hypothetical protein
MPLESFLGRRPSTSPPLRIDRTDLEKVMRQAAIAAAGAIIVVLLGHLEQAEGVWWAAGAITLLEFLRRWLTGPVRAKEMQNVAARNDDAGAGAGG